MVFALSLCFFLPAITLDVGPSPVTRAELNSEWLHADPSIAMRAEASGALFDPTTPGEAVSLSQDWRVTARGLAWDLSFSGQDPATGYETTISLPVLARGQSVFAATAKGVMSLDAFPSLSLPPYGGHYGLDNYCVLPLVSVLDSQRDRGLTIALPPDTHLPYLQIEWEGSRLLRLRLGHRAIGAGVNDGLSLLFYTHAADYRSALAAYSDDFPAYFRPGLPRGEYEGPFYYHHIQDAPDLAEQKAQGVRWIWSSFWFPYLGEMLPAAEEWEPYTYARWWSLGETMTDAKINAFVDRMHQAGIGTYAYFNTTEYGGYGGAQGDADAAERAISQRFDDALVRDAAGNAIGTWEASKAMNPSRRYSYAAHLDEQVRRHLERLPGIDGFCIDRLDWADTIDYGHDDGHTMIAGRSVEHMSGPVAEAVQRVCELSHEAGKRVFVNQFYRIDVLRDVDGYCHEYDYARGLGYLSPYRPASAWHYAHPPAGGMVAFEAQLKTRLLFAIFPQMVAHEFPISQQGAHAEGADMLEAYEPLFAPLIGADQVLLPHCVEVTGPNDANLFVRPDGTLVAPVVSRVRAVADSATATSPGVLTLRVPDASSLQWAHVATTEGDLYAAQIERRRDQIRIALPDHRSASVVTVGAGAAPPISATRVSRGPVVRRGEDPKPALGGIESASLWIAGRHLGATAPVRVALNGYPVGALEASAGSLEVPAAALGARDAEIQLDAGCEGAWFYVDQAILTVTRPGGRDYAVARWVPQTGAADMRKGVLVLTMSWMVPLDISGQAPELLGVRRAPEPNVLPSGALTVRPTGAAGAAADAFSVNVTGSLCVWAENTDDPRVPGDMAECWHSPDSLSVQVSPKDERADYEVTLFLLDFDRNGRSVDIEAFGLASASATCSVSREAMDEGAYVSFRARGPVRIEMRKTGGYNAVLSAILVDAFPQDGAIPGVSVRDGG